MIAPEIVESFSAFSDFEDNEIQALATLAEEARYRPGQFIFHEGNVLQAGVGNLCPYDTQLYFADEHLIHDLLCIPNPQGSPNSWVLLFKFTQKGWQNIFPWYSACPQN